jgi:LAO/AO transport system kinase
MNEPPANRVRPPLPVEDVVEGIRRGDRAVLARAITLLESARSADRQLAREVLQSVLPDTGSAYRVGISGPPGVGKSTFIESLGMLLTEAGHRVAVLAVDPSSSISGGSILGDKSRMPTLASSPGAFIRPSPNALSPGGVGRRTRESMLLCEAAGFDVVLIETVGVGQSEIMVADVVDFFLVLLLPGAGDELQGIKKGILELADLVAINKADGEYLERALQTQKEYANALRYLPTRSQVWQPPVIVTSGRTGDGLDQLWQYVQDHRETLSAAGELASRRRAQNLRWMWSLLEERLKERFVTDPRVAARLPRLESAVRDGELAPSQAAEELLDVFAPSDSPESLD